MANTTELQNNSKLQLSTPPITTQSSAIGAGLITIVPITNNKVKMLKRPHCENNFDTISINNKKPKLLPLSESNLNVIIMSPNKVTKKPLKKMGKIIQATNLPTLSSVDMTRGQKENNSTTSSSVGSVGTSINNNNNNNNNSSTGGINQNGSFAGVKIKGSGKTSEPVSVAKRNARERSRVKKVNEAFAALRARIPNFMIDAFESQENGKTGSKKLSKVDILRFSKEYIMHLRSMAYEMDSYVSTTSPETNLNDIDGIDDDEFSSSCHLSQSETITNTDTSILTTTSTVPTNDFITTASTAITTTTTADNTIATINHDDNNEHCNSIIDDSNQIEQRYNINQEQYIQYGEVIYRIVPPGTAENLDDEHYEQLQNQQFLPIESMNQSFTSEDHSQLQNQHHQHPLHHHHQQPQQQHEENHHNHLNQSFDYQEINTNEDFHTSPSVSPTSTNIASPILNDYDSTGQCNFITIHPNDIVTMVDASGKAIYSIPANNNNQLLYDNVITTMKTESIDDGYSQTMSVESMMEDWWEHSPQNVPNQTI